MKKHSEEVLIPALEKSVNKQVEVMRNELNAHIERVEPILTGYETLQNGRKFIMWTATFITVVGGAILIIKQFLSKPPL